MTPDQSDSSASSNVADQENKDISEVIKRILEATHTSFHGRTVLTKEDVIRIIKEAVK